MVRTLETVEPVHGRDVTLSIDADLQQAVLGRVQRERTAAAVVIDVNTGGIVALVSVPGFDPATIAGGISEADWRKLATAEDKPLLDRVVSGQYHRVRRSRSSRPSPHSMPVLCRRTSASRARDITSSAIKLIPAGIRQGTATSRSTKPCGVPVTSFSTK